MRTFATILRHVSLCLPLTFIGCGAEDSTNGDCRQARFQCAEGFRCVPKADDTFDCVTDDDINPIAAGGAGAPQPARPNQPNGGNPSANMGSGAAGNSSAMQDNTAGVAGMMAGVDGNLGGMPSPPDLDCPLTIDKVFSRTTAPASIDFRFRVLDCNGDPVTGLSGDDIQFVNGETDRPFNASVEGGSAVSYRPITPLNVTVIAIDLSQSVYQAGRVPEIVMGVTSIIDELVTNETDLTKRHMVAVVGFGANQRLLANFSMVGAPNELNNLENQQSLGTTNLFEGYMYALDVAEGLGRYGGMRFIREVKAINSHLIFITDGVHEAGNADGLLVQALNRKMRSTTNIITVGIGDNVDPEQLSSLASEPNNAILLEDLTDVIRPLRAQVERTNSQAKGFYKASICTPVSEGRSTYSIQIDGPVGQSQMDVEYDASELNGAITGCDAAARIRPPSQCVIDALYVQRDDGDDQFYVAEYAGDQLVFHHGTFRPWRGWPANDDGRPADEIGLPVSKYDVFFRTNRKLNIELADGRRLNWPSPELFFDYLRVPKNGPICMNPGRMIRPSQNWVRIRTASWDPLGEVASEIVDFRSENRLEVRNNASMIALDHLNQYNTSQTMSFSNAFDSEVRLGRQQGCTTDACYELCYNEEARDLPFVRGYQYRSNREPDAGYRDGKYSYNTDGSLRCSCLQRRSATLNYQKCFAYKYADDRLAEIDLQVRDVRQRYRGASHRLFLNVSYGVGEVTLSGEATQPPVHHEDGNFHIFRWCRDGTIVGGMRVDERCPFEVNLSIEPEAGISRVRIQRNRLGSGSNENEEVWEYPYVEHPSGAVIAFHQLYAPQSGLMMMPIDWPTDGSARIAYLSHTCMEQE